MAAPEFKFEGEMAILSFKGKWQTPTPFFLKKLKGK